MSDTSLISLEEFFLALSDGTRLRLLSLMQDGEVSVGYLSEKLDQSQPKISRHLAYLRSAGLVETRRDGKWIYYHVARPAGSFARRTLQEALSWAGSITGDGPTTETEAFINTYAEPEDETWSVSNVDEIEQAEHESAPQENYSNEMEVYLL